MVTIRIKDYVQFAYTYEEGQVIYNLIYPPFGRGETVAISFDGIKAVPSSFLNAAILQLFDQFTFEEIRERLRIEDSTSHINDTIRRSFDTVNAKLNNPSDQS